MASRCTKDSFSYVRWRADRARLPEHSGSRRHGTQKGADRLAGNLVGSAPVDGSAAAERIANDDTAFAIDTLARGLSEGQRSLGEERIDVVVEIAVKWWDLRQHSRRYVNGPGMEAGPNPTNCRGYLSITHDRAKDLLISTSFF